MRDTVKVTVSGSFNRHFDEIKRTIGTFQELGAEVASPKNAKKAREEAGFVYLEGEKGSPEDIERNHLKAIASSDALYVVAPDGYVGTSTALEIGYALALNVPVWSSKSLDAVPHRFFADASSEQEVFTLLSKKSSKTEPPISDRLNYLQEYYVQQARRRGFDRETPEQVFVLLVEEVGELAKALRAWLGLSVHSEDTTRKSVKLELADCFIYLLHMANQLRPPMNLYEAFREKERLNAEKDWSRPAS